MTSQASSSTLSTNLFFGTTTSLRVFPVQHHQPQSISSPEPPASECFQSTTSLRVFPVHHQPQSVSSPEPPASECFQSRTTSLRVFPVHHQPQSVSSPEPPASECFQSRTTSLRVFPNTLRSLNNSAPSNETALVSNELNHLSILPSAIPELDDVTGDDIDLHDTRFILYPGTTKVVPVVEASFKITFFVALMLLAIVGNVLVIVTVIRCRQMHKTTYYYLVNLAVSDLAVTLLCSWVYLVDDLTEGWVLGAFFCKVNSFVQVLSLVSSILTMVLIACDRFFSIVFTLKARLTALRLSTFILLVWIVSAAISAPTLFYREQFTAQWLDYTEITCRLLHYHLVYYTTISFVLYFAPMVVVSLVYAAILWKLRSHQPPGDLQQTTADQWSERLRNKKKVILMLVIVLTVFGICRLPLQISILYTEYYADIPEPPWYKDFQYFATFLAYANSAFNPIIYTCFNDTFRKGFIDAFKPHRDRHPASTSQSRYLDGSHTTELRLDTFEGRTN